MTGYTYGAGNPVDNADPSGQLIGTPGGDYCPPGQPGCEPLSDYPSGPPLGDGAGPAELKRILATPMATLFGSGSLPGRLLEDLRQFDYYRGSAVFTMGDMITWLTQNSNKPWSNQVWLAFCEGLGGGSAKGCSNNPLNDNPNVYRSVPLGKALAGIGLTMTGLVGGAACQATVGDDTVAGSVACGFVVSGAVNAGLTAMGGKRDSESVTMMVVSTALEGLGNAVGTLARSEAATGIPSWMGAGRAWRVGINVGVGAGVDVINYGRAGTGTSPGPGPR
jgi:hypothetical protein